MDIKQFFNDSKQFLAEVKEEVLKITWPTRKVAASGAVAVIVFVLMVSIFLGLVDVTLSYVISYFVK